MPKKIAIMQPYAFPYIGYMNLINAVDEFVFYDDVNFIKKGWVNRNQIILMGRPYRFSIPLRRQSQNSFIKDTYVDNLCKFSDKFIKQLSASYKPSAYREPVLDYVREVFKTNDQSISLLGINSVLLFFKYIGLEVNFLCSSVSFASSRGMGREERLATITKLLNSTHYINPIGGASLYNKNKFASMGVNLKFLNPKLISYHHCNTPEPVFFPGLSVIDLMMNLSEEEIRRYLRSYELL